MGYHRWKIGRKWAENRRKSRPKSPFCLAGKVWLQRLSSNQSDVEIQSLENKNEKTYVEIKSNTVSEYARPQFYGMKEEFTGIYLYTFSLSFFHIQHLILNYTSCTEEILADQKQSGQRVQNHETSILWADYIKYTRFKLFGMFASHTKINLRQTGS